MSAKRIDVLAILDEYADTMGSVCQQANADELREARAVVAELMDFVQNVAHNLYLSDSLTVEQANSVLARIGGDA